MPKKGTGKTRVEAVLMDVVAAGSRLLARGGRIQQHAAEDTMQDLRDDALYALVEQRLEIMQELPIDLLRGHLALLKKEFNVARADDLERTAGDAVRKEVLGLQEHVESFVAKAHELMGEVDEGGA